MLILRDQSADTTGLTSAEDLGSTNLTLCDQQIMILRDPQALTTRDHIVLARWDQQVLTL